MRFTWVITSPLFLARTVLGLLMLLYLLIMIKSHSIPLSGVEGLPLSVTGWVAVVAVGVLASVLHRRRGDDEDYFIDFAAMGWRWIPHLAFAVAAGFAFYFACTGNIPSVCHHTAACLKLDNWRVSGGHYYRQYPYDSSGSDYPSAPWVEISRPQYVAEHGTILRGGALFGLITLSVAWLLSAGLGPIRRD